MTKNEFVDWLTLILEEHDNDVKGIEFMGVDRDQLVVTILEGTGENSFLLDIKEVAK